MMNYKGFKKIMRQLNVESETLRLVAKEGYECGLMLPPEVNPIDVNENTLKAFSERLADQLDGV